MLDGAIKCQKMLKRLEEHDPSYLPKDDIPIAKDWNNAKVFVKFLKTFSEVTMKFFWIYVYDFKHIFSQTLFDPINNLWILVVWEFIIESGNIKHANKIQLVLGYNYKWED